MIELVLVVYFLVCIPSFVFFWREIYKSEREYRSPWDWYDDLMCTVAACFAAVLWPIIFSFILIGPVMTKALKKGI